MLSVFQSVLTALGGPALILGIIHAPKRIALLIAVIAGIRTSDKERRKACVQMVHDLSRPPEWPLRQPGSQ